MYFILSIILLFVILQLWVFIWFITLDSIPALSRLSNYLVYWIILIILFLWMYFIARLITYFYSLLIITPVRVIKISYWLFFSENIKIIDLKKVISINSKQQWFFQTVCNYWKITLRNANQTELILEKIPHPKLIAKKIDDLCKKA